MAEMQILANMKQRIEKLAAEVQGVQKGMYSLVWGRCTKVAS